jgi:hypothetical protein
MQVEIDSLIKSSTFKDIGNLPYVAGYKNIRVHFVFAVKRDLCHKAIMYTAGHLTGMSTDGTYSIVDSLQSVCITIVAVDLNNFEIMVEDISSAYIEAYTHKKVWFMAGTEIGPLEDLLLVIVHALYGLWTSDAHWHDRLSDVLQKLKYYPCKAVSEIWLKEIWVIPSQCRWSYVHWQESRCLFDSIINDHQFQPKGVGKPTYHLWGDFFCDSDGSLAWGANLMWKMFINYETIFGCKPNEFNTPIEEKDQPKIDSTEILDAIDIEQYQSLISAL